MEQVKQSEAIGSLHELESLVASHYEETMSSFRASSGTCSFLTIWQKDSLECEKKYKMTYLPLFYVIASQDKDTKLSLKLITFHGKILEELSGYSNLLSNDDKLKFIAKLNE